MANGRNAVYGYDQQGVALQGAKVPLQGYAPVDPIGTPAQQGSFYDPQLSRSITGLSDAIDARFRSDSPLIRTTIVQVAGSGGIGTAGIPAGGMATFEFVVHGIKVPALRWALVPGIGVAIPAQKVAFNVNLPADLNGADVTYVFGHDIEVQVQSVSFYNGSGSALYIRDVDGMFNHAVTAPVASIFLFGWSNPEYAAWHGSI